jgi:hypothetical protein
LAVAVAFNKRDHDALEEMKPQPFVYHLPFTQTSDIPRFKRAYYRHRFSRRVIGFALQVIRDGNSARQVERLIKNHFGYKISHVTILTWGRTFVPHIKFPKGRSHDSIWRRKISEGVLLRNRKANQGGG